MHEHTEPDILDTDLPYEVKALDAYLSGQLGAKDLMASLEVSRAQMYRMIERYRAHGPTGLVSRKIGRSNRAYSAVDRERVTGLVRELYADFGPKMACEKLEELHDIKISQETLRQWMMAEGLWLDRAGRKPRIYTPRKPRELRGELVQVDGSYHRWFEKRGPEACLLVFIDDATSEIMHMQMDSRIREYSIESSGLLDLSAPRCRIGHIHTGLHGLRTDPCGIQISLEKCVRTIPVIP